MNKVRFELDRQGVKELMQSQEALNVCKEYALAVQARAGDGYTLTTYVGKTRANASVIASTKEAKEDNLEHNTLLKALGGGL